MREREAEIWSNRRPKKEVFAHVNSLLRRRSNCVLRAGQFVVNEVDQRAEPSRAEPSQLVSSGVERLSFARDISTLDTRSRLGRDRTAKSLLLLRTFAGRAEVCFASTQTTSQLAK